MTNRGIDLIQVVYRNKILSSIRGSDLLLQENWAEVRKKEIHKRLELSLFKPSRILCESSRIKLDQIEPQSTSSDLK